MQVNIVKLSQWRIPRRFLVSWLESLQKELKKRAVIDLKNKEITLVFVDKNHIKKLNLDFRSKPKVTDILSFSGMTEEDLGELVICGEQVNEQSFDHGLSKKEELGYMVIHGVLHLLGYDHEKGGQQEKEMFELQDSLFDVLRKKISKM